MIAAFLMVSCSGGSSTSPLTPSVTLPRPGSSMSAERHLLGFWDIRISADRLSFTVTPVRGARMHLNVLHILEEDCLDCLIIDKVKVLPSGDISADLILKHPFPGQPRYTGFDVRGILITGSDYEFPGSGKKIARGDEQIKLMNADGYTSLFNPTDFPENPELPYLLQYTKGKNSEGEGPFDATLNPYLAYSQEKPRRMFAVGTSETRTLLLDPPEGEIQFGYAVDASWAPVDGEVNDPVEDFPPDANCLEAYAISVTAGEVAELTGGKGFVEVWAYDHQGAETIESVSLEVPDLFEGEFALSFTEEAPDGAAIFTGWIPNSFAADEGEYLMLVRVRDTEADPNLGQIDAWQLSTAYVGEAPQGWARTWGGEGDDRGNGPALDEWGNIYTAGFFRYTVDFDPGPGEDYHTATGYHGAFLSKINPEGDFQWAKTWGPITDETSINARDVVVDPSGGVYVTGYFSGIVDFDPGPGQDFRQSDFSTDIFLSKFDTEGNFQWVRVWGGADNSDDAWSLAVGNSGNVFVTGRFQDTVDFDPGDGVDEHTANGRDVFLSGFDSEGVFLWARTWGGTEGPSSNIGYGAAADGSGNVFVTGEFKGAVDFDPGPGEDIQSGDNGANAFLSKFDGSGNFLWARTWGTTTGGLGFGREVDVNGSGESFVTGIWGGTLDFDPGEGEDFHSSDEWAMFLTGFDSEGNHKWARTWGGGNNSAGWGVALHDSGNIYVTGPFSGSNIDFDPGPGEDLHSSTGQWFTDVFLSKFTGDGDFLWARTWGGPDGYDFGYGVAVNNSQTAYVTGYYSGPCDFDPGPGEDIHPGGRGVFLSKFPADGNW